MEHPRVCLQPCSVECGGARSGHRLVWFVAQDIYVFAYGFSLEKGVKCMQQEVAIAMWRLIFCSQPWPLLDAWSVHGLQAATSSGCYCVPNVMRLM